MKDHNWGDCKKCGKYHRYKSMEGFKDTTYVEMYGEEKADRIKCKLREKCKGNRVSREIRICQCGNCSDTFECKVNSKQKYIRGHYLKSVEGRKKRSEDYKRKYASGEFVVWNKDLTMEDDRVRKNVQGFIRIGEERRDKTLEQIYGEEKAKKISDVCSRSGVRRILRDGNSQVRSKSGYFYSNKNGKWLYYMSSYELIAYQILESMSKVMSYKVNSVCVKYEWNGGIHRYLVDILVWYDDGSKELIEVKSQWMLEKDGRTKLKLEAGRKYALENGLRFSVWTEKELF